MAFKKLLFPVPFCPAKKKNFNEYIFFAMYMEIEEKSKRMKKKFKQNRRKN